MHQNNRIVLPRWALPAAACVLAAALLTVGVIFASRTFLAGPLSKLPFVPNLRVVEFHKHFALDPKEIAIIFEKNRVVGSDSPIIENNFVYLPFTFVRDYLDEFLFWDEYANSLFVTTPYDVLQFIPETIDYYHNGEKLSVAAPILLKNEKVYLPARLVEVLYRYEVGHLEKYNLVVLSDTQSERGFGITDAKADMRYRPDSESPISVRLEKGEALRLYEQDGEYTLVRNSDGLPGYVLTSSVASASSVLPSPHEFTSDFLERDVYFGPQPEPLWPKNIKVYMMWEGVYSAAANASLRENPIPSGVNVVAPTWFSIDETTFDVKSIADRDYVNWAKSQGAEVWAVFSDVDGSGSITSDFLTSAANRRRAVARLAELVSQYNLDGINVDLENVRADDGPYYVQFIRELAPSMRAAGAVLSADVYVPSPWSAHYRRDLVGKTAEFVAVMTYNEHYSGSPESGPVASLPFVEKGVEDMLKEVPAEKLLMGLPFYNYVWREVVNDERPETRRVVAWGMERTIAYFDENNTAFEWHETTGSYYGEFATVEDGEAVVYKVWLEDQYSIAEKLKIYERHNLAGVAGWVRGLENEETRRLLWEIVR